MPVNVEQYKIIYHSLAQQHVQLIAVSKTKPNEDIIELYELGQRDFGENYVQELVSKIVRFPTASWHFIGSLQRNKCKQIVGKVALIHSVDREELAAEINKIAERGHLLAALHNFEDHALACIVRAKGHRQ